MANKVKIFNVLIPYDTAENKPNKAEDSINQWLNENAEVKINDIRLSTTIYNNFTVVTCMILYREKEEPREVKVY